MKKKTLRIFWGIVGGMVIVSMVMFSFAIGFSF
jgi:hypothetical protein